MTSQPWWRGAVIYQIYPRSFRDTNGDGVGDLAGIIDGLPYVADLGVDGIWLSPFFRSPMRDFGYDVADFTDVDPLFGSLADFDRLLAEAHRLGLRVIIDQVYSHTSNEHPWFRESRSGRDNAKADWYVWADPRADGTPPNNWLAHFGGPAWTWEPRRRQYYLHNFLAEQPDLNFHTGAVQDAVLDAARFWLDRGVDGFRLDVANFYVHDPLLRDNPPSGDREAVKPYRMQRQLYNRSRPEAFAFVARLRALLDRYPGAMAVAEIASEDPVGTMIAYTDGDHRYHTAYSFEFLGDRFGAAFVRHTLEAFTARSATAWPSWAFSNHDVPRVISRWGANLHDRRGFAKVLIALLGSLRGTAFLFQGEELGLPQADVPYDRLRDPEGRTFWPADKGRDGARTPMPWRADAPFAGFSAVEPWLPLGADHPALAVDRQLLAAESVLTFTRRFLRWRRDRRSLVDGDIRFLPADEPVVAFLRGGASETLLVVLNLGADAARWPLPSDLEAVAVTGHGLPSAVRDGAIDLPPFGGAYLAVGTNA